MCGHDRSPPWAGAGSPAGVGTPALAVAGAGTAAERFDSITNDGLYLRAISRIGSGS